MFVLNLKFANSLNTLSLLDQSGKTNMKHNSSINEGRYLEQ